MARGGKRTGTPGTAYKQRTDLHQPITAASGGPYGQMKQLEDAQRVIPLPSQPASPPPAPSTPGGGVAIPGQLGFTDPTQRPNEPVTAGLPVGPGPGPEALNLPDQSATTAAQLRTMYANVPAAQNNDFLRLLELAEQQAWQ